MKNIKLKTLILSSIVLPISITPCITSCGSNSEPTSPVKVTGAKVDTSKTHLEVDRDSTIYLIPNNNSKITGIKSITVGTTVLTRMGYSFEYEQTNNSLAYKLTLFAKSMTSLDISIEVHTTDIDFDYVAYSGGTITTNAVLKPLSLEVVAKYKDVEGTTPLAPGEFKVFDDDKDITAKYLSEDGYRLDQEKTYKLTIQSVIDTSKTKTLDINITKPTAKGFFETIEYEPERDEEIQLRLTDFDFDPQTQTEISPIYSYVKVGWVKKYITTILPNPYTVDSTQPTIIKQISFEHGSKVKTIETGAFDHLKYLEKITLPETVEVIGKDVFKDCEKLTTVYLDSQTIVNLTNNDSKLFSKATNIFIKNELTVSDESYIAKNFTKQTTGDQYTQWTPKQQ